MFRIRKITDDIYPMNKHAVGQVMDILRQRFSSVDESKILLIPEQLRNPLKYQFRSMLLVADNFNGNVKGFALLFHAPDLDFCYLDYIATHKDQITTGVGGALYERCRDEALMLKSSGIFMECLPDDEKLCPGKENLKQNASRLRFYERYGARPIINTLYETPVKEGDTCPPYLVLDNLDQHDLPSTEKIRKVVKAILYRKYGDYCPDEYIHKVVDSFKDDPVKLRDYKYISKVKPVDKNNHHNHPVAEPASGNHLKDSNHKNRIYLAVNNDHEIHHVKEVGYVEAPVRISRIMKIIGDTGIFETIPVNKFSEKYIRQVHSNDLVDFLKNAGENFPKGNSVYPYIFPIRNLNVRPRDVNVLAGYFCIDTFTPIHHNVWKAATGAVDCAMSCANKLIEHGGLAYALVRPPGHHAETRVFGGFCYLNTAAIAANYLSKLGKVAILDIDYHHGNGQQEIFYKRSDVITVSLHGHPSTTYPYFCGFRKEKGEGEGTGFNINFPLDEGLNADEYRKVLADAMQKISSFKPDWLVVCFGLDTAKGDPTGTFSFGIKDFEKNGRMIGSLGIPTLVVQEGGYLNRSLGNNALHFFKGLKDSFYR
ncbi:MAG: histone deacetylase family protein [Bacteroidales bacterium]|nr:histone deacetylase family protein [Bacteroidales bacterium]